MVGHHLGYGILGTLGDPTGKRVQVTGMSHYHWKNGKIVDEWTVYDEMSLLPQVKLGQMANGAELEKHKNGSGRTAPVLSWGPPTRPTIRDRVWPGSAERPPPADWRSNRSPCRPHR